MSWVVSMYIEWLLSLLLVIAIVSYVAVGIYFAIFVHLDEQWFLDDLRRSATLRPPWNRGRIIRFFVGRAAWLFVWFLEIYMRVAVGVMWPLAVRRIR